VRWPLTVQALVVVRLRLLAPADVGVCRASHRQDRRVVSVWRPGAGRLVRCWVRRH